MRYVKNFLYIVGLPALLLIGWVLWSAQSTSFFVPTWEQMTNAFANTWTWDRITSDLVPSVTNLLLGILISIILGIVVGLLVGSFRWLRQLSEPVMEFFRAVPPVVLIPVFMLLIGIGNDMKIAVIVLGAVWPILLNTVEGVRSMDEVLSDTSHTYPPHGSGIDPASAMPPNYGRDPSIVIDCADFDGHLRNVRLLRRTGLHHHPVPTLLAIPEMWSGIVVLGLIGVIMSFIFQLVERRVLAWYHGQREMENAG